MENIIRILKSAKNKCGYLLILCLFLCFPVRAYASSDTEREVVRVGFFEFDAYHMMDKNGTRSGYGYDFLRMAAKYMDVDYEYVGYDKSWDEMQKMLENGEIDLLTSAQKTPEREKIFDFSEPIGTSSGILTIKEGNTRIVPQDYRTYNGMKVGMLRNNTRNTDFADLAAYKGFTYEIKYYDTAEDVEAALQDGEVDGIVTSSLRVIRNEKIIEKFAARDFYAMVKKGNKDLLQKVNYAIDQMNAVEGNWKSELQYKYYSDTNQQNLEFTDREKKIISKYKKGKKKLIVSCNTDRNPYSYVENGKLKGIIPEVFSKIMEQAGIPYEIKIPKDRAEYEKWQNDGSVDIFMDARDVSEKLVEEKKIATTEPYMNMRIAMITRRDFKGAVKTLAVAKNQGSSGIEKGLSEDARKVMYRSREDAIKAVLKGKADAAYVYQYTAQKAVNEDERGVLTYSVLDSPVYEYQICIMSQDNHELSGILTKSIYRLSAGEIESIISEYTSYKAKNMNLFTFMRIHPVISTVILLGSVASLMLLIFLLMRLQNKKKMLRFEQQKAEEMDILARQAQDANESKSRFLFNMSHDIRTPMNAVIGFTNLAIAAGEDTEKVQDYLSKILLSSEHLLEIVNDVLETSRIESGKIQIHEEECCITELLDEVSVLIREQARKKGQQFIVDISGIHDQYILCDKLRWKEILINLLGNAVKFTQEGGKIELIVRQLYPAAENIGRFEIHVKDNGCGMSNAFMEKMFQPFEREQSSTVSGVEGTGLGLSITKRYVELMGGSIDVTSEEGKGSEFIIHLSQKLTVPSALLKEEMGINEAEEESLCGKRILVVEDNELNREIIVTVLREEEILVEEAENGIEALKMLEASEPGYYDAVLMDVQMPLMDGYTATRKIRSLKRQDLKGIPVIAMTANAFAEDIQNAKDAGMDEHLAKPLDMDCLKEVLKRYINRG